MGLEPVTSWLRTRGTNHYTIAAQEINANKEPVCYSNDRANDNFLMNDHRNEVQEDLN